MSLLDWGIVVFFISFTIWDGIRQSGKTQNVEGLLLANRSMPWWAIGISVMATQASAISFIATTGYAYVHDMGFLQMYLGLPIAMIILCVTLVPFFYKARVFTAYEILEKRFGLKVRLATSALFLLSRGLAMGTIIAAPAYVLALILNISLTSTILLTGLVATVYTTFGGIRGVIRTDIKQLSLMMVGLFFCFFYLIYKLPDNVSFSDGLHLAGSLGKLNILDFNLGTTEKYTIWSGLIAGVFLFLSYFGSDQTQVQRFLTAKSLNHARGSLILSALAKLPMMFFMLLIGVMLYVFFIFKPAPLLFIPKDDPKSEVSQDVTKFNLALEERRKSAYQFISDQSNKEIREAFKKSDGKYNNLRQQNMASLSLQGNKERNDTNYVLPYFVLNELPHGIIGLIIAAIFAAAFSSMDSGLNSLAGSTTIDWYQRLRKKDGSDSHYLSFTRWSTVFWGLFATAGALLIGETRSLIELVNQIGSYFYGSILGVFVILFINRVNGTGAFIGLICGIISVFLIDAVYVTSSTNEILFFMPELFQTAIGVSCPSGVEKLVSYLWLNPIGTIVVVTVALLTSFSIKK